MGLEGEFSTENKDIFKELVLILVPEMQCVECGKANYSYSIPNDIAILMGDINHQHMACL